MSDNINVITSQDVLYFSLGLGAFLWAIFNFRRGYISQPTRLNLRESNWSASVASTLSPGSASAAKGVHERHYRKRNYDSISLETLQEQSISPREKSLNVVFIYNGHNFDAYEVLGVPAGARGRQLELAYQRELAKATGPHKEFIDLAYFAIIESNKRQAG